MRTVTAGEDGPNAVRETYFDAEGNPTEGEAGFVTRLRLYSGKQLTSERWFDAEGLPDCREDTYCRVDYTYDQKGNVNREKYYDAEGNPVSCLAGYAIVYREFDALSRVVYEKFFGPDGFAVRLPDGTVSRRYTYDDDGNLLTTTRYDFSDQVID